MEAKQYHVAMLPWMAFGHMLPYLKLAKKLAAKGILVSFISTSKNIQRLPPTVSPNLKFVEIQLPSVKGLPENCEATIDLQPEKVEYLKKACDRLLGPLEEILTNDLPDIILFDFVHCWVPRVARNFGVKSAFFSAYAASTLAFIGPPSQLKSPSRRKMPEEFSVPPKWFPADSLVSQSPYQASRMCKNMNFPDVSGMSSSQRWIETLEACDFVAVRSSTEFEGEYLNLLRELYKKPVLPVGLLPPCLEDDRKVTTASPTLKWLDQQLRKSVLFVGFGTEYKMPLELIHELAYGLELSGLPFIWVLREPKGIENSELLPPGFLARTAQRGLVSLGWAPQVNILSHSAIGGCLYHSGWSSIVESLGFGVPQILMPMVDDQGFNAKLLVEKGIGLEVPRNEDGSFAREEVARSIRYVMVDKEGEAIRVAADRVRTVFSSHNLHDSYVNKFVQYLSTKEDRLLNPPPPDSE